ncbi:hypothetical protein COW81_03020 [Candidatus Campbellbacteria bacterium CG22_combo_CG10-13_8_21_14_all_36_13]|uniref:Uncharacterized protein n=1 Tax=Candidatus Campbellbacteria bacterium CG22_combo_CG10-13_8_21_14_all_36_13 TaxID=1974529 RepID=A0A2H0DXL1_9BACT|nr:MAG: hypothetical protein COW81_03020 [Candidatus Campbellbacteria bacterium CG22_combo_CG10-13_8_21_14_all_36_13]
MPTNPISLTDLKKISEEQSKSFGEERESPGITKIGVSNSHSDTNISNHQEESLRSSEITGNSLLGGGC